MSIIAVVTLPKVSNIPEDAVQNVWAFLEVAGGPDKVTAANLIGVDLDAFYKQPGASGAVQNFFANSLSAATNAVTIDYYDGGPLATVVPPLGTPYHQTAFTLDGLSAGEAIPAECAACMSFHGVLTDIPEEVGATRPRSRRRGRVYLGPLAINAVKSAPPTNEVLLNPVFQDAIRDRGLALMNAEGALEPRWGVWSRVDGVVREVVGGHVDNAFDTQRRRGPEATNRLTWNSVV